MQRYIALLISLFASFSAGFIGSYFTFDAIPTWYETLERPFLSPPNWIFGPVWSTLYALMAVSAWRVWEKRSIHPTASRSLFLYALHLGVNALWSIVFFGLQQPFLAVAVILVLWICIVTLIVQFSRIDRLAAWLLVPYLLWVSFASYLNISIALLN